MSNHFNWKAIGLHDNATAEVGQTIRVKSVDENNLPTEWEAVNAQADWNQNDETSSDYIKNRPFGIGIVEILPETTIEVTSDELPITTEIELIEGNTYTVNWNGVEYTCIAQKWEVEGATAGIVVGDLSVATTGESTTGEPFLIADLSAEFAAQVGGIPTLFAVFDESTSVTLSIVSEVVNRINPKYLPEGVPYVEYGLVDVIPETTITLTNGVATYDKIDLVAGSTCVVNWNGTVYNCVAQEFIAPMEDGSIVNLGVAVGNIGAMIDGIDTGEPFAIASLNETGESLIGAPTAIQIFDGSESVSIQLSLSSKVEIVHKLDNKFIDAEWMAVTHKMFDDITWDGDITDRESIDGVFYKVSDNYISAEDFVGAVLTGVDSNGSVINSFTVSADNIFAQNGMVGILNGNGFNPIAMSINAIAATEIGVSQGVYVICDSGEYISSIVSEVFEKIPEKYLPDNIGGGSSIELDSTLSTEGKAADAKAVGDALKNYAKTNDIPTKTSQLTNDSGYLTSIPEEYVTDSELIAKGYATADSPTFTGEFTHGTRRVNSVVGDNSFVSGYNAIASGSRSHAEGTGTIAYGQNSHAEGEGGARNSITITIKANSTNVSYTGTNPIVNSLIEYNANIRKVISVDINNKTFVIDSAFSDVDDYDNVIAYLYIHGALGNTSHAEGYYTVASGEHSHAECDTTMATGDYSHAEGGSTTASGEGSHAEGISTTASGVCSHAECGGTIASGMNSHAEGSHTIASGNCSHAEGRNTIASGDYSHAEGYNTIASRSYSHVQGTYNIEDTNGIYAHIVGNGNNYYSGIVTSNAHTLDWEGNAWFAGDVYVGSTSGTNKDEGSVKLIRSPATATVGQTIRVSAIDENGVPTAWEAFDPFVLTDESTGTKYKLTVVDSKLTMTEVTV